MIEVRKRLSHYQEKYIDTGDSTAKYSAKREFTIRDSRWGRRSDNNKKKLYKTMCIFFEFPTK